MKGRTTVGASLTPQSHSDNKQEVRNAITWAIHFLSKQLDLEVAINLVWVGLKHFEGTSFLKFVSVYIFKTSSLSLSVSFVNKPCI